MALSKDLFFKNGIKDLQNALTTQHQRKTVFDILRLQIYYVTSFVNFKLVVLNKYNNFGCIQLLLILFWPILPKYRVSKALSICFTTLIFNVSKLLIAH